MEADSLLEPQNIFLELFRLATELLQLATNTVEHLIIMDG